MTSRKLLFTGALCLLSFAGLGQATASPGVRHIPIADAAAEEDIALVAEVQAGWSANLQLMVRGAKDKSFHSVAFERSSEEEYVALISAQSVRAPHFDYFIVSTDESGTLVHFADAEHPHRVYVYRDSQVQLREEELARFGGKRAQIRTSGEYVDFGTRDIFDRESQDTYRVDDSYYRLDLQVTYRVMRYPLRAMRFGYSRLIGTTPTTARGDGYCTGDDPDAPCTLNAGYRAGGWVETQWRLSDLVSLDTRGLIQATPTGFGLGGRAELRFGDEAGSHFAMGAESITEVGTSMFVRLAWATVPHFPMAATIELSDYPSSHRSTGVRLLYDLAYEIGHGMRVGVRAGYQARDQGVGGPALGSNLSLDF